MHFRADITPPVLKVAFASLCVGVFDYVWCTCRRSNKLHWRLLGIYALLGWAIAMIEEDAACQSPESYTQLSASWGSFVGCFAWGAFYLRHDQELCTFVDIAYGVINCTCTVLLVNAISWS